MNTLNKICTSLAVVFAVSLAILVAQILYVLWRRRTFGNRSLSSGEFSSESLYPTPSKELLYFFCWKNQASRIEPDAETTTAAPDAPPITSSAHVDVDVDELLKRHALYGPSRVLFTIKEEEREEMETELSSSAEKEENKVNRKKKTRSVSLEEIVAVAMMISADDATPFSTPCASPPYYTPSPSPSRDRNLPQASVEDPDGVVLQGEYDVQREPEKTLDISDGKAMPFVNIEIQPL
ncbi:hypothetical protein JCGZ_08773 [Jatropha curcas]|uniref:Uncharacterized protein n=1 Tax=Jatropha curcas TaxID=180498 RepID=A0A067KWB1_JATCU|nr:uncharacterized protein LOC105635827 [Jatropha curcas]KDP36129.1 hypothetical protein JCGZ_08773 [Jatropha curcas]